MAKAKDFSELELKQEQNVSTKVERELNAEFAARPSQFDAPVGAVFMKGSFNPVGTRKKIAFFGTENVPFSCTRPTAQDILNWCDK